METKMNLEQGRALVQGMMTLVFVFIAYSVNTLLGLALLAFMGIMRIQESRTDWCPSDIVLKQIGLKKKAAV